MRALYIQSQFWIELRIMYAAARQIFRCVSILLRPHMQNTPYRYCFRVVVSGEITFTFLIVFCVLCGTSLV